MKTVFIRSIAFIICVVMLLSVAACGKNKPADTTDPADKTDRQSVTETPASGEPVVTTEKAPTSDVPPATTDPKVTDPPVTEDPNAPKTPETLYKKYKDYNNVFVLNGEEIAVPDGLDNESRIVSADMRNGVVAVAFEKTVEKWDFFDAKKELTLYVFDILRGKKIGEASYTGSYIKLRVLDSGEVVLAYLRHETPDDFSKEKFELVIFNPETAESTVKKGVVDYSFRILSDGTALRKENTYSPAYIFDVHDPEKVLLEISADNPVQDIIGNAEDYYIAPVSTIDWSTYVAKIYKADGRIEYTSEYTYEPIDGSGTLGQAWLDDGWFIKGVGSDEMIFARRPESYYGDETTPYHMEGMLPRANNAYFIISQQFEADLPISMAYGTEYNLYSFKNGRLVSSLVCDDSYTSELHALEDSNDLLIVNRKYNEADNTFYYELLLWRAGKEEGTETVPGFRILNEKKIEEDTTNLISEIKEKTDADILFDAESLSKLTLGYDCRVCEDKMLIYRMILRINSLTDYYPEGFFRELRYNNKPLRIYVCGNLSPVSSSGLASAEAFAAETEDSYVLCFSTNFYTGIKANFAHEVMHLVDYRLSAMCFDANDFRPVHYWTVTLNDGPYDYYNSYHDKAGNEITNTDGTRYGEGETYYVDAYSKTYPTEDKSRVMEKLFIGESRYFEEGTPLTRKAQYLVALVRYVMPSVAKFEEPLIWEQFIGIHTMDEFDVFK